MIIRKVGSVAALVVATASQATAQSQTTACLRSGEAFVCTEVVATPVAFPRIISLGKSANGSAAQERYRRWIARCHPVMKQDAYGVHRYQYAARGCEFGKNED